MANAEGYRKAIDVFIKAYDSLVKARREYLLASAPGVELSRAQLQSEDDALDAGMQTYVGRIIAFCSDLPEDVDDVREVVANRLMMGVQRATSDRVIRHSMATRQLKRSLDAQRAEGKGSN